MVVDRRDGIAEYIESYRSTYGYGPSIREIASDQNISLSLVHHYLHQLIKEGVLSGEPSKARTWRLRVAS